MTRLRIGVTVGDPAGIGPEVVSAALSCPERAPAHYTVYGDLDAVERAGGLPDDVGRRPFQSAAVSPGTPDPAAGPGIVQAIEAAARDCLSGELDAMATAPISKEVLGKAGFTFPGHTELLAEIAGGERAVMLLVGGSLRVALATIHVPLREVPAQLDPDSLFEILGVLDSELRSRFRIDIPRIAVCGLNPHAGEGGRFGDEESRLIAPAVERAVRAGIGATGPFSADSLFHQAATGRYDAVLAMYHDQGLAPLKVHAFGRAVNVTLGLRLIRTSVDHGTAFDIAGGSPSRADAGSMLETLRVAVELAGSGRQETAPERKR